MTQPPIVVDTDVSHIDCALFHERRPELEISDSLSGFRTPSAFMTTNRCWKDEYLDDLAG